MSLAIDRFYDELTELLELPIYVGSTPEELTALLRHEIPKYAEVIHRAHIRVE